jgi:hypothetical protein
MAQAFGLGNFFDTLAGFCSLPFGKLPSTVTTFLSAPPVCISATLRFYISVKSFTQFILQTTFPRKF